MFDVNISHQVVLERPELPDLSKSGPPEPMDDTPPSPQVMIDNAILYKRKIE